MAKVQGRAEHARADKSLGAGKQECLRHAGGNFRSTDERASSARLDKLKHILRNKSAEMSLGAADTSVRATSAEVQQ